MAAADFRGQARWLCVSRQDRVWAVLYRGEAAVGGGADGRGRITDILTCLAAPVALADLSPNHLCCSLFLIAFDSLSNITF